MCPIFRLAKPAYLRYNENFTSGRDYLLFTLSLIFTYFRYYNISSIKITSQCKMLIVLEDSLHDRRSMSQAGRTRYFARSATRARSALRGEEKNKNKIFLFHSSHASRSCCAPRAISRCLAHKAPVTQATFSLRLQSSLLKLPIFKMAEGRHELMISFCSFCSSF